MDSITDAFPNMCPKSNYWPAVLQSILVVRIRSYFQLKHSLYLVAAENTVNAT